MKARFVTCWLAAVLVGLIATPGEAQHWATRDVCTVTQAEIHPQVFDPPGLEVLETRGATYINGVGKFWRVVAPDGATSHLWGTMHSSDPLILDLPDPAKSAIEAARMVAVEVNYIAPTRRAVEIDQSRDGWYRKARSNFEFASTGLPPRIISNIRSRTAGLGWGRDAPDFLTLAGLLEVMIGDPCEDFSAGTLPIQDDLILTYGMISGAKILSLEPRDALMERLSRKDSQDLSLSMLAVYGAYLDPEEASAEVRASGFALYLQGRQGLARAWDQSYLRRLLGDKADHHLALTDGYLLAERNQTFLETALSDLKQGGVFMAIGSFHLSGQTGMVQMLREAGFAVTRIPLDGEIP